VRGTVTFFTNYQGRKGREVIGDPRVAVCFHWDQSDRQVRIEGIASKTSQAESDAYFQSRRWESRLSAWASDQSEPIESREALLAKLAKVVDRLGLSPQELLERGNMVAIPRPPHWGGFTILARSVEFWIGGPGRMHDRAVWTRDIPRAREPGSGHDEFSVQGIGECGPWIATRLQP
jgi:pyridoxamine 5'-phosphate oxidase